jgi:hypothetical protein
LSADFWQVGNTCSILFEWLLKLKKPENIEFALFLRISVFDDV